MAKTVIKVNRNVVDRNKRLDEQEPVITALHRGRTHYGDEIQFVDDNGRVVASVVYRPDDPQPCGATVWIETHLETRILNRGREIALPGAVVRRGGRLDDFLADLVPDPSAGAAPQSGGAPTAPE